MTGRCKIFAFITINHSTVAPLPLTAHQLRVHLQYLGYPVANDPVYSEVKIWVRDHPQQVKFPGSDSVAQGPNLGKNGIDLTPSDSRSAPAPPPHLAVESNPETPSLTSTGKSTEKEIRLLPRETGQDIGMSSPVPLSIEAVGVITRLRNTKVNVSHERILSSSDVGHLDRMRTRTGRDGATSSSALKVV
jgi:hypothetical protein